MSAPATYDDLRVALRDYQGIPISSGYANGVDLVIDLAESRFNNTLRTRRQLTTVTMTPDASGEAPLPDDYAGFKRAVAVDTGKDLVEISPELMTSIYPVDYSGLACHIAVEGGVVRVRPLSSAGVRLTYYAKIPALSDANTTNWLLTEQPGLYLAACLYEWSLFFEEGDEENKYAAALEDQMGLLMRNDMSERVRTRSVRVKGATP